MQFCRLIRIYNVRHAEAHPGPNFEGKKMEILHRIDERIR